MRVALISDSRTSWPRARSSSGSRAPVDRIVCLGDVATGPASGRVLEALAGQLRVLGNHDAFLLDAELIRKYTETPVVVDAVDARRAALGPGSSTSSDQPTLISTDGATLGLFHGCRARTWRTCWRRLPRPDR
jgi:hypothetical protein